MTPAHATAATEEHCAHCFDNLLAHYSGEPAPPPAFADCFCPLFVTWNKPSRRGDLRLRGCIGTLEPRQLQTALREYALTSALRDRRFSPIQVRELGGLTCTVSLLHGFEEAKHRQDWEVGKHGLIVRFTDPYSGVQRSATFLPEVAKQEGWSKADTLDALIRKADYHEPVTEQLRSAVSLTRYQTSACSLSYAAYQERHASGIRTDLQAVQVAVAVQA